MFDPNVAGTFSLNLAPVAVDDDDNYAASREMEDSIGIPVLLNDTDPDHDFPQYRSDQPDHQFPRRNSIASRRSKCDH